MANKKNTNTIKSDVKKDSLKNTSNTSNKSNSKGNTMKKVIKVKKVMSVSDKNMKLTAKREASAICHYIGNNDSFIARLALVDVMASNGKVYTCIIRLSANKNAYVVEVPNTGLSTQKGQTVVKLPLGLSKSSKYLCDKVDINAEKKESDTSRRNMAWSDYVAFVLNAKRTVKDKATKEVILKNRYNYLDTTKKKGVYILGALTAILNGWIESHNKAMAKAQKSA